MMKRLFLTLSALLLVFAAAAVLHSCNKEAIEVVYEDPTLGLGDDNSADPEPEAALSFSRDEITLDGLAQQIGVIAITNVKKVTASSDKPWCRVSVSGNMIAVDVDSNDGEEEMTATVTVTASALDDPGNKVTETFDVVQKAKVTELNFEQTVYTVYGRAGEIYIDFTTNSSQISAVTRAPEDNWCTATVNGNRLTVTTTANPGSTTRTAIIDVTAGAGSNTATATLTINQQDPALDPDPTMVGDMYGGGMIYWRDAQGTKGCIMTIGNLSASWSSEGVVTGATFNSDDITTANAARVSNYNKIKERPNYQTAYPAHNVCAALGEGWYLPVDADMKIIVDLEIGTSEASMAFKQKLADAGGTAFGGLTTTFVWEGRETEAGKAAGVDKRTATLTVTAQNKVGSARGIRCVKDVVFE
jgi:hypothetical protein